MSHVHTGHGPDKKNDCHGCAAESRQRDAERFAQHVANVGELGELREKVAYLRSNCLNLSRDQLIEKITEVGSSEWKAGVWLSAQRDTAFRRGVESVTRSGCDGTSDCKSYDHTEGCFGARLPARDPQGPRA